MWLQEKIREGIPVERMGIGKEKKRREPIQSMVVRREITIAKR